VDTSVKIITIIVLLLIVLVGIVNIWIRYKFSSEHNITIPKHTKVRMKYGKKDKNYFQLQYPFWNYAKKDGTADLRIKYNSICWQTSTLYFERYIIKSKYPTSIIMTVKRLRTQGYKVELCKEEEEKFKFLLNKKRALACDGDVNKIVEYYADNPTDFEKLCAEVFKAMGYDVKVTPQTNDGGYDLLLEKNEDRVIVECKCYNTKHSVGRPAIQKLVGANKVVFANKMFFVTTSDFSAGARTYAEETGVELYNGKILMDMLQEHLNYNKTNVKVSIQEVQLNKEDIQKNIPSDIFEQYFM